MNTLKRSLIPILTILTLLVSSCITEQRCQDRFPATFKTEIVKYDTTIVTHSTHFDTVFNWTGTDTIYLKDKETQIQVKVIRVRDSIYIHSECPPDSIIVEKVRTETTIERAKNLFGSDLKHYMWLIVLIVIMLILMSINGIIKNIKR
jgi:hypothetical protein